MHVAIALISIFAAWRWADCRHWQRYHSTMLYITAGGLLYEYLTRNFNTWVFHPDFLYSQRITVVVYAVVTMPLNVLLYLSRYPSGKWIRQLMYILLWIAIYGSVEWVLQLTGRITYQHNWSFWFSVLFDVMMFPMLILHHKKPIWAYLLSVPIVVLLLYWFKVPANG